MVHVYLKRTRKLVENTTQHETVFKETTMNIFMDRIHNLTKSSAIPSKQTCIKYSKHKRVRLVEQELLSLNSTPFCSGFVLLNL
jgi:hypothetical protein